MPQPQPPQKKKQQQIEQLKFQLEATYKRDRRAIQRTLEILEKNYEDQKRALEHLDNAINDPESQIPEYIPPVDEVDDSLNARVRRSVSAARGRAQMDIDEDERMLEAAEQEVIPLPARKKPATLADRLAAQHPEVPVIMDLAKALAQPFTLKGLYHAWQQSVGETISGKRLKALVQLLRKERILHYYQLKGSQGITIYYQPASAKVPIKDALTRMLAARKGNAEVAAQTPANTRVRLTQDQVDDLPPDQRIAADTGAVRRSTEPPAPRDEASTALQPSVPAKRRRRERR